MATSGELPALRPPALDSPGFALPIPRGYGKHDDHPRSRAHDASLSEDEIADTSTASLYHFIDMDSGEREWNCELSSIDTSLLLCGVLAARQHFDDAEIQDLATAIYERVDWPWMLDGGKTFSMGWKPGAGFLRSRWDHYCELMMFVTCWPWARRRIRFPARLGRRGRGLR